ncbi:MAG: L-threonylcarbamoyladenylate synthase [Verrucomicrobiales bacterium]|jgi:L-threonylcarbamoyladenylate synthase
MMVDDVARSIDALERGEVVVIPTDTVYGLAADPKSPEAMRALFALKQRPEGVPTAVLIDSIEQASELILVSDVVGALAAAHWPGALTIVASATDDHGLHIGSSTTVGVRLPDHDFVRAIAVGFGPIAATSANRHGEPTITDPRNLAAAYGTSVEVIIDGGVLEGLASTVVDATKKTLVVLRQGVVHLDQSN